MLGAASVFQQLMRMHQNANAQMQQPANMHSQPAPESSTQQQQGAEANHPTSFPGPGGNAPPAQHANAPPVPGQRPGNEHFHQQAATAAASAAAAAVRGMGMPPGMQESLQMQIQQQISQTLQRSFPLQQPPVSPAHREEPNAPSPQQVPPAPPHSQPSTSPRRATPLPPPATRPMRRERTDAEGEAAEAGRGLRDLAAYVSANGGVHLVCICAPPFYIITP